MNLLASILGWGIILGVLWDAFTTIVMPKTVERRISLAAFYYNGMWNLWHFLSKRIADGPVRRNLLGAFAPISLIFLFLLWASLLIFGFAFINWAHSTLGMKPDFLSYVYYSGVTFFTLGYGDLTPHGAWGRLLSVAEAGTGFGLLAILIGYIPVLYGRFSVREHQIMLLDARAGSDPTAGEILHRCGQSSAFEDLIEVLKEWERWSAEQLEAYLSYPILAFYRSQHDHQSWLCSLTAVLDTCALIEIGFQGDHDWQHRLRYQAQATFAMGRHVIVDLAYILGTPPDEKAPGRLSDSAWQDLKAYLDQAGFPLVEGRDAVFAARRAMYEPYCVSLARDLFFTLPAWLPEPDSLDNWQFSAWDKERHF